MSKPQNKPCPKEITFNIRTHIDGDITTGINHKLFEFNRKTFELQRVVFKRQKDTYFDRLFLKWFGHTKPHPDSYFFTSLNMKNAISTIKKKFNVPFVYERMKGDDECDTK